MAQPSRYHLDVGASVQVTNAERMPEGVGRNGMQEPSLLGISFDPFDDLLDLGVPIVCCGVQFSFASPEPIALAILIAFDRKFSERLFERCRNRDVDPLLGFLLEYLYRPSFVRRSG